jgi:nucleotide-binding universal stress UspA family protein
MFLGSGAEQIIRLAPVPVLVVRSPESEQGAAA